MKKVIPLAIAFTCSWVGVADAHGPTRQKVTESIEIAASPDVVWNLIKDFGNASWMPAVAKTEGQGGNEKGASRTLTLKKGGELKEEIKDYEAEKKSISYRISDEPDCAVLPVKNYSSTITVNASANGSTVEWKGAFYRCYLNNDPPADQNEAAAIGAITGVYKESLANLKALAEKK